MAGNFPLSTQVLITRRLPVKNQVELVPNPFVFHVFLEREETPVVRAAPTATMTPTATTGALVAAESSLAARRGSNRWEYAP